MLPPGPGPSSVLAISRPSPSGVGWCAIDVDGGVDCASGSYNCYPYVAPGQSSQTFATPPRAVVAGLSFQCVLTNEGAVQCWGDDLYGELGDGATVADGGAPTNGSTLAQVIGETGGVTMIAASGSSACALRTGGEVDCWGASIPGQPGVAVGPLGFTSVPVPVIASGAVAIAVGGNFPSIGPAACAALDDGSVECWGPVANEGITVTHPVPVPATAPDGGSASCTGTVCWGDCYQQCGAEWVDESVDSLNCGACGTTCGGSLCAAGRCLLAEGQSGCKTAADCVPGGCTDGGVCAGTAGLAGVTGCGTYACTGSCVYVGPIPQIPGPSVCEAVAICEPPEDGALSCDGPNDCPPNNDCCLVSSESTVFFDCVATNEIGCFPQATPGVVGSGCPQDPGCPVFQTELFCDPLEPSCPPGQTCKPSGGQFFCSN